MLSSVDKKTRQKNSVRDCVINDFASAQTGADEMVSRSLMKKLEANNCTTRDVGGFKSLNFAIDLFNYDIAHRYEYLKSFHPRKRN